MGEAVLVLALCGVAYWLGWKHRDNWDWLRAQTLKSGHPDVVKDEGPQSMIVEALTPEEEAKQAFAERVKRLNS